MAFASQAVCGGDKTLADVPDADYFEACKLTDLMGTQATKMLDEIKSKKFKKYLMYSSVIVGGAALAAYLLKKK